MIQVPRGTQDILPSESYKWQFIEKKLAEVAKSYNYKEIRTPVFESTELFVRGVGGSTDIVNKEMYTFQDKGDRSLTLRPEGTAPVVRSYIENKMQHDVEQPTKLYYLAPMFRYERKQKGRYRQFVQFGIEAIGVEDPLIDVEVISMLMNIYQSFGLKKLKLKINSIGDIDSRNEYNKALVEHFSPRIGEFCSDCQSRINTNPMRILDCKKDKDHELVQTAPRMYDYLNNESKAYFEAVKNKLDDLDIEYEVDYNLVRGLDYYTHTAFELMSDSEGFGAITTLCGGGRYNGLLELLDGPQKTGIGFALSIERLLLALEAEGITIPDESGIELYICTMTDEARDVASTLLHKLRKNNISAEMDYENRKLKAQMKDADRKNARYTIVLGDDELSSEAVDIKEMATGDSKNVKFDELIQFLEDQ
ncbi:MULTISPECIES: histidine--tRNA ligase [Jeotgalicoccus]|jgi:histidyl-tRNA synthetase|uniref:histidine--tRNA ligase n=1 Tax=Jeotgalicoccus TaxID=227979 RepID=UPI000422ADDA|nr:MULTISPECIES: histidine--tRNA ligase [Jeotgalicoccus]QQD85563.1 histidine--tRNA ligase [Jeotgalicoccus sp. ATCC 8456]